MTVDREQTRRDAENAGSEPLNVDISDFSDEFCRGYLSGQQNAVEELHILALLAELEQAEQRQKQAENWARSLNHNLEQAERREQNAWAKYDEANNAAMTANLRAEQAARERDTARANPGWSPADDLG